MVALLVFGVSAAGAATQILKSNIDYLDVDDLISQPDLPDDLESGRALNILLIGSDDRSGENALIGGQEGGMRSDTTIIMHISADRSRVELVSIPRDSLVDIPSCTMSDGSTTRAQSNAMFNSAFATGWDRGGDMVSAAACTINTVQENTGLRIDHFVVVDFAGFQDMIDAVDGVDICVEKDLKDKYTNLQLNAGMHLLNGEDALKFARVRHGTGTDGSDIGRMARQQQLLGALADKVLSSETLSDPQRVLEFTSAVTSSLTMDKGMDLTTITGLAYSLRQIRSENIMFMTTPWSAAPTDPNRVVWTSKADKVWAAMAADTSIVAALAPAQTAPSSAAPTTASASPGAVANPTTTPTPELPEGITSVAGVGQEASVCSG